VLAGLRVKFPRSELPDFFDARFSLTSQVWFTRQRAKQIARSLSRRQLSVRSRPFPVVPEVLTSLLQSTNVASVADFHDQECSRRIPGLLWTSRDVQLVEAAGIEPASAVLRSQAYILSLVIWVSPCARRPAGWRSASRFDGCARPSDQTAHRADENDAAPSFEGLAHQQASAASSRY